MSARRPLSSGAVLVVVLVVSVFSSGAPAAAGDGYSRANAIALQPDGKIVAVGTDDAHPNGDFALARYNPNGSPDPELLQRRHADDRLRGVAPEV
jgi:hypothetical protein